MGIITRAAVRKQKEQKVKGKQLEEKYGVTSYPLMKRAENRSKGDDHNKEQKDKSEEWILSDLSLAVGQENDTFWSCVIMQLGILRLLPYAQLILKTLLRN